MCEKLFVSWITSKLDKTAAYLKYGNCYEKKENKKENPIYSWEIV